MNAKEGVIRECAGAATMKRVQGKYNSFYNQTAILYSGWIVLDTSTQLMLPTSSISKSFFFLFPLGCWVWRIPPWALVPYAGYVIFWGLDTLGKNLTHTL